MGRQWRGLFLLHHWRYRGRSRRWCFACAGGEQGGKAERGERAQWHRMILKGGQCPGFSLEPAVNAKESARSGALGARRC
ncbi:hypothetical protein Pstr01_31370 [Pseudomonas straminea]|nr:hypothetical protein Pstr01_31370 [Pseudomonas straminea]